MAKDKTGMPTGTAETLVMPSPISAKDKEVATPTEATTADVSGLEKRPGDYSKGNVNEGKPTVSRELVPPPPAPTKPSTEMVQVKIGYPKGYDGVRHYRDGDEVTVSLPTAEIFVESGIATIL